MYIKTTATDKIFKLRKRVRGVAGGTSASKTISIILWCIKRAEKYNELTSIVSETFTHLKRGAMRDFLSIMEGEGWYDDKRWNKTDCIYTFPSGARLEFFSADQPGKVRGPRRDNLFINEANNISYETYTQLEVRTRGIVWLDWNPVSEFWWYTDVMPKQDVDFLILTYRDNEALDPAIVSAIESRRSNINWWRVYGEGLLGEAEGRIYKDWEIVDDIPHEARLERYGLDFGYSNDPTAIIGVYKYNSGFILDQVVYQTGLKNREIGDILKNIPRALVIADSAEPKSIDELSEMGINIIPSIKGAGSVLQGIQYVQDQRISVTKKSIDLIKEYRNYLWQTDKNGKVINDPVPVMDHCMDAVRYGLNSLNNVGINSPNISKFSKVNLFDKRGIVI